MRKLLFIICYFISPIVFCFGEEIHVEQTNCRYCISIPEGWTIYKDTVVSSNGFACRTLFLSMLDEREFEKPSDYVMITFLPSLELLDGYSYKQMRKAITRQFKSGVNTDSLKVVFQGIESVKENPCHFQLKFLIQKENSIMECDQLLYPTKLGYISMSLYNHEESPRSMNSLLSNFEKAISVDDDYVYSETTSRNNLFVNLLISIGIGLIVYSIISLLSKRKK